MSTIIQKTKWFDGANFVPCHVGEYETDEWSDEWQCYPKRYWNGKVWSCGYYIIYSKGCAFSQISLNQNPQWRGIKK